MSRVSEAPTADSTARKQGWRPCGRAAWHKPDGTVVHLICFADQRICAAKISLGPPRFSLSEPNHGWLELDLCLLLNRPGLCRVRNGVDDTGFA